MRFGYHHSSYAGSGGGRPFEAALERIQHLEDLGFDLLTVMDHVWQLPHNGARDEPFFDAYSVLPAAAAVTDRMELSALVTCVHYRNPALLAKMVASLDHASGGRAVLGIGAGWYEDEYDAYGYEYPPPAERIAHLDDAVGLATALWTEDSPVTHAGEHYAVEDAILEPKPIQDPHPPVMIGGGGEQLTLRVVAEHADRWNVPMVDPEAYAHKLDVLAGHCEDAGRDYDDIEKTVLLRALLRDETQAAHEAFEGYAERSAADVPPRAERVGIGTPSAYAALLEEYRDLGVEQVMIAVPRNDEETVETFVDEVAPEFA